MKKNKKIAALLLLAAVTTSINAAELIPTKRVLTPEGMKIVGQTPVIVAEINNGIEKRWTMVSGPAGNGQWQQPTSGRAIDPIDKGIAEGAGGMILGAIEAIQNDAPFKRAQKAASEVAELLPASAVQRSLLRHLEAASTGGISNGVSLGPLSTAQKILDPWPSKDALEVSASYMLAEDASAFRAVFQASYTSSKVNYTTPYSDRKVPRSERTGPIYRNVFTYRSARLPVPVLTPADRPRLIAAIEDSYRDEQGQLPAGGDESRKMAKEIEAANDDEFTKDELAVILTRQWLADDGKLLRSQLEDAHAFFVKYLVLDLNSTELPKPDLQELEAEPGAWIVRQLGKGSSWGAYERIPDAGGDITQYATYGNSSALSKAQQRKVFALKKRAENAKRLR